MAGQLSLEDSNFEILLIEDDRVDALRLTKLLELISPKSVVKTCESVHEAIELIDSRGVDIIISDLRLTDSEGLQTFDSIKARAPEVPIIVLTGNEDKALIEGALQKGAQDYLMKDDLGPEALERSIIYSIKRQRVLIELQTARIAAEIAVKAKREFLETVSHELRTPLNGILGFLTLLLETPLNEEQSEFATTAKECAEQQLATINDILHYTELSMGATQSKPSPCVLREWLVNHTKQFQVEANKRGIDFSCSVSAKVPKIVELDRVHLHQVLTELLENALKYTDHGSISLHVEAREMLDDELKLQFLLRDTGKGVGNIPEKDIFEPFVQGESFLRRERNGLGLGLALAASLVRQMGGAITVSNNPEGGSTFVFSVPVRIPKGEVSAASRPIPESRREPPHVLVVEDNSSSAHLMHALLTRRGYTVSIAAHGKEALAMLDAYNFSAIFMDLQMPTLDGLETAKRIRSNQKAGQKRVPIVAVTAHASDEDRELCLSSGMDYYVPKPINVVEIDRLLALIFY